MLVDSYLVPGPLTEVRGQVDRAVQLGCDAVFSAETSHDPFLPLVTAAQAAPQLTVGTAIAVAFARSPMTTAYQAWDLAQLTGGRFLLGLGSQIRAHVVGRFSMPWSAPVERMAEYIRALRAIWDSWQTGERLRFRGEAYRFSLMTPFFSPGPIDHPEIPIWLAAVGEQMCQLVGAECQGIHIHPFHTRRYLEDVVAPAIDAGARSAGRQATDVVRSSSILIATGHSSDELAASSEAARSQIAFYASTPAYRRVLEVSGWDIGDELNALTKRGKWGEMAQLVPDELLNEVAVIAPVDDLAEALDKRAQGVLDRCGLYPIEDPLDDDEWSEVIAELR